MYCPFCGYELPDDAKYCQRCGRKLPDYNNTSSHTARRDVTQTYTTTSGTIDKQYIWNYGPHTWKVNISIPKSTYLTSKNLERTNDFNTYVSETRNREVVRKIADAIVEAGGKCDFSGDDYVRMAVAFVQSIPYKTDLESTGKMEYYKYPVETLVDGGGDCEDSSILIAAILREWGYGVVLLSFDKHIAVGVKCGKNACGAYWTYNGDRYFYLETTGKGWEIGEIPDKYKNKKAKVIAIY